MTTTQEYFTHDEHRSAERAVIASIIAALRSQVQDLEARVTALEEAQA